MIETGNFKSCDNTSLFFRALPFKRDRDSVVIVHGFAEHSGRYREIMHELNKKGFNVLAFDLRGHGHSSGRRGFINLFQDYVDDLDAAVRLALSLSSKSVLLLAHSMGGLIATNYALQKEKNIHGLVLSSPLFGIQVEVPAWKSKLGEVMSKYWPSFSMPNKIEASNLTHDKLKAEDYQADPLIFHHVTARWFEEISLATENILLTSDKLKHPVLLQQSGEDRIVSSKKSCEWFEKSSSSDKELILYKDFFHEIYNEENRKRPISDMISWLENRWPQPV